MSVDDLQRDNQEIRDRRGRSPRCRGSRGERGRSSRPESRDKRRDRRRVSCGNDLAQLETSAGSKDRPSKQATSRGSSRVRAAQRQGSSAGTRSHQAQSDCVIGCIPLVCCNSTSFVTFLFCLILTAILYAI